MSTFKYNQKAFLKYCVILLSVVCAATLYAGWEMSWSISPFVLLACFIELTFLLGFSLIFKVVQRSDSHVDMLKEESKSAVRIFFQQSRNHLRAVFLSLTLLATFLFVKAQLLLGGLPAEVVPLVWGLAAVGPLGLCCLKLEIFANKNTSNI